MIHRLFFGFLGALLILPMSLLSVAAAHAQEASPHAAPSMLAAMLARVPAEFPELDAPEQAIIAYADIAAQLDAVGVTAPDHPDDAGVEAWAAATSGLPLPAHAAQFLPDWREDYGFDLLQADQTLWISLPPYDFTLYRGRFDEREIRGALTDVGYEPIEVEGQTILSVRGDYEPDLQAPTAYPFAAMNYATILDDGTLVFASAQAPLAAVLAVAAGKAPALADRRDVAPVLAQAPADLVGAQLVPGTMLAGGGPAALLQLEPGATPDLGAIATEMAEQAAMPPVVLALLGSTAGGSVRPSGTGDLASPDAPRARAVAVLLLLSPGAAETAASVVTERLATGASSWSGEPFTAYFPEHAVEAVPGAPVLVIALTLGEGVPPNMLVQLLTRRDLGFLAW